MAAGHPPMHSHRAPGAASPPRRLRYELDPEAVGSLREHPRLRFAEPIESASEDEWTGWFDTEGMRLRSEGIALSVRQVGAGWMQRIEQVAPLGRGRQRRRISHPVVTGRADLDAIPDRALRERVAAAAAGAALEPVVSVRARCECWRVALGSRHVTLALRQGRIETARGDLALCELELTPGAGDSGSAHALARELHDSASLRPAAEPVHEPAFRLLTGVPPAPVNAERPELEPKDPLDDAVARVFESALSQIVANQPAVLFGVDSEGVHQMRVGVRRLRSALSLLAPLIGKRQRRPLKDELRWLFGELGAVRDVDVFAEDVLPPVAAAFPSLAGLKRLAEVADEERARLRESLAESLRSPRYGALVLDLAVWIARRGWREAAPPAALRQLARPARAGARPLLERRQRAALARGGDVALLSPAELHRLRIELKRLRYATHLLGGLFPDRGRPYLKRLARLQTTLGQINDAAMIEHVLDDLLAALGPDLREEHQRAAGVVSGWMTARCTGWREGLPEQWLRFRDTRPSWQKARR